MGQYHLIANLDKLEYITGHPFGDGVKLMEFGSSGQGTMMGLAVLLAKDNGLGGGDLHASNDLVGHWAGDRIVIAGDYGSEAHMVPSFLPHCINLYSCATMYFTDISYKLADFLIKSGELEPSPLFSQFEAYDKRNKGPNPNSGLLSFEDAYIKVNVDHTRYFPSAEAIKLIEVGDTVVTWYLGENNLHMRKVTAIHTPKHCYHGLERYIDLDNGGNDTLSSLFKVPVSYVLPTKHGLYLDMVS